MDTVFMEAVMNAFYDKVVKKEPSYDKNVLKNTWQDVNTKLINVVLGNVKELPELPKKHSYNTCTYPYEKGDKAGKLCGKMVKNDGQDRCYLHNAEKMEKKKAEAKKKLEEKKAKAIDEEVEKKLAEKMAKLGIKESGGTKTANQTVVADNEIVKKNELVSEASDELEDSDEEESGSDNEGSEHEDGSEHDSEDDE